MTGSVPILMYHSVAARPGVATRRLSVSPQAFADQIGLLADQGFTALTFGELARRYRTGSAIPNRPVVLTFDDGYADFAEVAWPILERHDFAATVFVTTGWLSGAGADAAGLPPDRMLDWAQLRELAAGGIEVAAHSHSHAQLDQLEDGRLQGELTDSRALLEDGLASPVEALAYPYGYSDPRVRSAARAAGYRCAASVRNVRSASSDDLYMLPRLTIRRTTDLNTFAAILAGADRTIFRRDRLLTAGWASVRGARKAARQLRRHA